MIKKFRNQICYIYIKVFYHSINKDYVCKISNWLEIKMELLKYNQGIIFMTVTLYINQKTLQLKNLLLKFW